MSLPEGSAAWEDVAHHLAETHPRFQDFADRVSIGRTTPIPREASMEAARLHYMHNVRDAQVHAAAYEHIHRDLMYVDRLIAETIQPDLLRLLRLHRLLILKEMPEVQEILERQQTREDQSGAVAHILSITRRNSQASPAHTSPS